MSLPVCPFGPQAATRRWRRRSERAAVATRRESETRTKQEVKEELGEEEEEEEGRRRRRRGRGVERPRSCCRPPTRRARGGPRGDAPERWTERDSFRGETDSRRQSDRRRRICRHRSQTFMLSVTRPPHRVLPTGRMMMMMMKKRKRRSLVSPRSFHCCSLVVFQLWGSNRCNPTTEVVSFEAGAYITHNATRPLDNLPTAEVSYVFLVSWEAENVIFW